MPAGTFPETVFLNVRDANNLPSPYTTAAGDGKTDDTAAIQAAINLIGASGGTNSNWSYQSAPSTAGQNPVYSGAVLYFPKGVYLLTSALKVGAGIHIVGDNAILVQTNPAADHLVLNFSGNGNAVIRGISFRGQGPLANGSTGLGVDPVLWSPSGCGRRIPPCPIRSRRIRLNSALA